MKQWILPVLFAIALGVALMYWMGEIPLGSHHHDADDLEEDYLNNVPDKDLTDKDRKVIESLKEEPFQ